MASSFSRLLGILFLMGCFATLMNPPPYIVIGTIFLLMGLVVLPATNRLTQQQFNWKIKPQTKSIIVIVGCILIYLVVPQIDPNPSPYNTRSLNSEDVSSKFK
ncbi:MAG TPA: hypothetical protein ACFCUY_03580 [Xenococcaceae cyanobacterium]